MNEGTGGHKVHFLSLNAKLAVQMNCFLGWEGKECIEACPQALLFLLFVQITVKKEVKYNAPLLLFLVVIMITVLYLILRMQILTLN